MVMSQGEWRYAAVTDNGPTLEPYFNETYAVCPSLLPSAQQKELKDLAISTLKCLGFTEGIFHVECKYTSHGPHLIEVNARMGGGQVHETNLRVWGVDLVEETLFVAAGIPCRPFIPEAWLNDIFLVLGEPGFQGRASLGQLRLRNPQGEGWPTATSTRKRAALCRTWIFLLLCSRRKVSCGRAPTFAQDPRPAK